MKDKRIVITGGTGFLGQYLTGNFTKQGYGNIFPVSHSEYDLVRLHDIRRFYDDMKPDIVVHLAARVGGIGFNQENPAALFYDNIMMGAQLMEAARLAGVQKFVQIGTVCSYPKFTPAPFKEESFWDGYPEETNAPYGIAKKALLVMAQAYRRQHGMNIIYLLPVNLYGPEDNFSLES